MAEFINLAGVTYVVISRLTADEVESAGRENTARVMRENNTIAEYVLQRPKGTKLYTASEFKNAWRIVINSKVETIYK